MQKVHYMLIVRITKGSATVSVRPRTRREQRDVNRRLHRPCGGEIANVQVELAY